MDFKKLSQALNQPKPKTVFSDDPTVGLANAKRQLMGLPPEEAPTDRLPALGRDLSGSGPIEGGSHPGQIVEGDYMTGAVDEMRAANIAQAAQDPNMAARLAATQAAIQKFREQQEGKQIDTLKKLPTIKKKKGPETYSAEE